MIRALSKVSCALAAVLSWGPAAGEDIAVDLELVIAVDASRSIDFYEAELQRRGYAQAIRSPEFLRTIEQSGVHGRIAIAYVEWAGTHHQKLVAGWSLVDGAEAADSFAALIEVASFQREYRTSISQAIAFSTAMFEDNGFDGLRRVIDISGDGANNQGMQVDEARDRAIERGITINGLPIMTGRANMLSWLGVEILDEYYADCVIGGPGAFIVPVREREEFVEAIRRKLLLEIAGLEPAAEELVIPAALADSGDCLVGERLWEQYRGPAGFGGQPIQ